MQVIRTIIWAMLAIALTAFVSINWKTVPVHFWPLGGNDYLSFDWPIGFIALFFFVAGMLPMWLVHLGHRWRSKRRIASLENAVKAATPSPVMAHETLAAVSEPS